MEGFRRLELHEGMFSLDGSIVRDYQIEGMISLPLRHEGNPLNEAMILNSRRGEPNAYYIGEPWNSGKRGQNRICPIIYLRIKE